MGLVSFPDADGGFRGRYFYIQPAGGLPKLHGLRVWLQTCRHLKVHLCQIHLRLTWTISACQSQGEHWDLKFPLNFPVHSKKLIPSTAKTLLWGTCSFWPMGLADFSITILFYTVSLWAVHECIWIVACKTFQNFLKGFIWKWNLCKCLLMIWHLKGVILSAIFNFITIKLFLKLFQRDCGLMFWTNLKIHMKSLS